MPAACEAKFQKLTIALVQSLRELAPGTGRDGTELPAIESDIPNVVIVYCETESSIVLWQFTASIRSIKPATPLIRGENLRMTRDICG